MEPCEQVGPHGPHEHYGQPASIRRDCAGCTCTGPYPDAACPSHGLLALLRTETRTADDKDLEEGS